MSQIALAITIPASVKWEDWEAEVAHAIAYDEVLNFKVNAFPTYVKPGDRCYVIHQGFVKGYQIIAGFSEQEFQCTTTGICYEGKFVQRFPKFYRLETEYPMKGFQGFRYVDVEEIEGEESLFNDQETRQDF